MNRHAALGYCLILAGLVLLLLVGCATDPAVTSALQAYDRAAAMGLARERIERPNARVTDGAPWTRSRGVEVAR